ncbi:MAG: hypothetical protein JZU65_03205 [Chlorobium sp.]|nr:hypothetical protein [Chlorobium sp.]
MKAKFIKNGSNSRYSSDQCNVAEGGIITILDCPSCGKHITGEYPKQFLCPHCFMLLMQDLLGDMYFYEKRVDICPKCGFIIIRSPDADLSLVTIDDCPQCGYTATIIIGLLPNQK